MIIVHEFKSWYVSALKGINQFYYLKFLFFYFLSFWKLAPVLELHLESTVTFKMSQ